MEATSTAPAAHVHKPQFPWKLHQMLDDATEKGYSQIVSWNPDGKSFSIHDKARFMADVMPLYFESSRFKSFQRSLNLWGFRTINRKKTGREQQIMHHFFQKGNPNQCIHMNRIRIKRREAQQDAEDSMKVDEDSMEAPRNHQGDNDRTVAHTQNHNHDERIITAIDTESSHHSFALGRGGQGLEPDHFYPAVYQLASLQRALRDIAIGLQILQALHFVSHCQDLEGFEPLEIQMNRPALDLFREGA